MTTSDHTLAELFRAQHQVAVTSQITAAGLSRSALQARLAGGRYQQLWPGVVMPATAPVTWQARAMGAQLYVGGEAALARSTAARVLGLTDRHGPDAIHLLVRDRVFPRLTGVTVHRTNDLAATDIIDRSPFRVTRGERTLADMAIDTGVQPLRRLLKAGVRTDVVDPTRLRAHLRRRGRLAGKRALLRLLDELSPLEGACRNEFESRFLRLMRGAGIEPTAMNHPVTDARGRQREIDAVWLPEHLPVELHSKKWHGSDLDTHDDLGRENDIVLTGRWRTFLRFSWWDVTQRGDEVVTRVRAALDAARTTSHRVQ